jgi:cytochrome c oxidase cbb3-type subunit III
MTANCRFWWIALLAFGFLGWSPSIAAQLGPPPTPPHAPHPKTTPESISQGKAIFEGTCANCHGIDGSGANGPNIQEAGTNLGPEGLYSTIYTGVTGSGMPSFASLGTDKIWQIVDYVSSLGHGGSGVALGDPQNGKKIYDANGCSNCHVINGQGGDVGPDLSKIGSLRSAAFLREVLLDPGANLPQTDSNLQERGPYPSYTMYKVTEKDGKVIEGTRVDEDSFTLQLRDDKGRIHSVDKLQGEKIEVEPGRSFMASYKDKLTDAQLQDLVSYLSTLGGAQ